MLTTTKIKALILAIFLLNLDFMAAAYSQASARLGERELTLTICQTEAELKLGLGGRKDLSDEQAMLFPFNGLDYRIFWMKGMLIPIDILWLRAGKIVHIEKNVPPPSPLQFKLPTYGQGILADAVLEVAAGFSDRYNIKLGQELLIKD